MVPPPRTPRLPEPNDADIPGANRSAIVMANLAQHCISCNMILERSSEPSAFLRRRSIGLAVLLLLGSSWRAAAQETTRSPHDACTEPRRLMATGCRTLELSGLYFVEAWDLNGRPRDFLEGGSAAVSLAVRDGWGAVIELLGMRIAQRPPNALVGGLSALVRKRLVEREHMAFFVEGGLGASYATVEVPQRGTRFNYLLQAGGGVTHRLGRRASVMLNLRLFHLSNNSLNGPDHNPDIEALGGHAGILVGF